MEQERYQTQLLMFSMQDLINSHNCTGSFPITNIPVPPPLPPSTNSVMVPQPKLYNRTHIGVTTITTPPSGFLLRESIKTNATTGNVSTPVMSVSNRKRKDTEAIPLQLQRNLVVDHAARKFLYKVKTHCHNQCC